MHVDHHSMPLALASAHKKIKIFSRSLISPLLLIAGIFLVLSPLFSWSFLSFSFVFVAIAYAMFVYRKHLSLHLENIELMGVLDACEQPCSVTAIGNEGDTEWRWLYVNSPVRNAFDKPLEYFLDKSCYNWGANICKTKNCGRECLSRSEPESKFAQDFGSICG